MPKLNNVELKKRFDVLRRNSLKPLPEIAKANKISVRQLQMALKEKKTTFLKLQFERRLSFLKQNQHLTNAELMKQMSVSNGTLSKVISEAKKRGLLNKSRVKVNREASISLAHVPSALKVARLMLWLPYGGKITRQVILNILKLKPRGLSNTLSKLEENGFIEKKSFGGINPKNQRSVKRVEFVITPVGKKWLNNMELVRIERDIDLMKTKAGTKNVLNRKENELDFYLEILAYSRNAGIILEHSGLDKIVAQKKSEIDRLRLNVYGKTSG
ncbi:MAG: hypothetical protein WC915_01280 [archaeon]|jgi:DNA-binding MarR family transcriptional regulator